MSSSNQTKKSKTMADLLKSVQTKFVSPHKGDVLEGTITKLTSSEILVDIGAKTEAVVLEKDKRILRNLLRSLKVGDKVTVAVLNPESDMGNTVVSLRRFMDEKIWDRLNKLLKNKEAVKVSVDDVTKGGFLVSTEDGISGFLPNSQSVFLENSQSMVGNVIDAAVIELNRPLKKIIFSQKALIGSEDFEKAVKNLKVKQKVEATIANVTPFGIFVSFKSGENLVEGFIHISEISWEKTTTVPDIFKTGQKIEAEIVSFDKEAKRVNLSIKNLTKNPFEEKLKEFTPDRKVSGSVLKVFANGVLIDLGDGIEGFIKKDKIPPTIAYTQGASVNATVVEVDTKKQRVLLVPVLKEKPIGYR